MKNIFILTVIIFLSYSTFQRTNACSCIPQEPPNIEYGNHDAVFIGKVTEISFVSWYGYPFHLVSFEVEKKWKGVYSNEVQVFTAANDAACGYDFLIDTVYLVYATISDDTLRTNICTRTNPVWKADEDLAYLNSLDDSDGLQPFGLQDKFITALAVEQTDYNNSFPVSEYIFAGTEDNGIFKASAVDEFPDWISFGLEGKPITALTVQHWGAGPADGLRLYAGVVPDNENYDSSLIFSREVYLP